MLVNIVTQVAEGLAALHRAGVVYNNLRGRNVLLASSYPVTVKLGDYVFRRHREAQLARGLTADNLPALLASPAGAGPWCWMAPECLPRAATPAAVLLGEGGSGGAGGRLLFPPAISAAAADVFMLGGVMFELLMGGRRPYYWLHTVEEVVAARWCGPEPSVVSTLVASAEKAGERLPFGLSWHGEALPMAQLMTACMLQRPQDRPSLAGVLATLQGM
jgi:hypothetical protein